LLNGLEHFLRRVNTKLVTKKRNELAMMTRLLSHTHRNKRSLELVLYVLSKLVSLCFSLSITLQETRIYHLAVLVEVVRTKLSSFTWS